MADRGTPTSLPVPLLNDAEFLHQLLANHPGSWLSWNQIMDASQRDRGHGLTIHSRAAQLRRQKGLVIECKTERVNGRTVSFYRLTGSLDPATLAAPPCGSRPVEPHSQTGLEAGVAEPNEQIIVPGQLDLFRAAA